MNLNLVYVTLWTGAGRGLVILMLEKLNLFCLTGLRTLVLLMRKWVDLFLWKNHLLKLYWDFYVVSIAKTASKKIIALICAFKFLSSEVSFFRGCFASLKIYHTACMKYCCHIWARASNCSSEMLDKLEKRICGDC